MKLKFLIFLFLFSGLLLNGQEIKLNSAVFASAGSNPELSNINISKWRLGEVHLIVLQKDNMNDLTIAEWEVKSYPNPFTSFINLDFSIKVKEEFTIVVTDILGKKQWLNEEKTVLPNQVIQLDLAFLSSAMYLVTVIPKDKSVQKVFKVQKQ